MSQRFGVYEKLQDAAPLESGSANTYLLGDGMLVSIQKRRVSDMFELDLLLLDEPKSSDTDLPSCILAGVGAVSTFLTGNSLGSGSVEIPMSVFAPVADAVLITPPAEHSQVYDWNAARKSALAAEPQALGDVVAVRKLIADFNQTAIPVAA